MDSNNYEELLKRAYDNLPEKTDTTERLEIPVPILLLEGNKTIITNFDVITNKLRREPKHLAKYLFRELASFGRVDGSRLIMNSKVNERILSEKLKSYTTQYLNCRQCKLPDTKLVDVDRGLQVMVCEACGARSAIAKL